MMNKTTLILTCFQKSHLLTTRNPSYGKTLTSLFTWLTENDEVQDDQTTQRLLPCYHVLKHDNMDYYTARLVAKEEIIVSGIEEIDYLLRQNTKLTLGISKTDGQKAKRGEIIGKISGGTEELLAYERTIVNILQRASGIAGQTNRLINLISNLQPKTYNLKPVYIAATRKTPWMSLDKKSVSVGGGITHRLSLSDGILIKDNHLEVIRKTHSLNNNIEAIEKALEEMMPQIKNDLIEIEVKTEEEARVLLRTWQSLSAVGYARGTPIKIRAKLVNFALLFDNFTTKKLKQTVHQLNKEFDLEKIILEASGSINEKNIVEFAKTGVDILSLGSLTHSAVAANISLEF